MTKHLKIVGFAVAFGFAASAPMLAQSLRPVPPETMPAVLAVAPQRLAPECDRDRAWLEAEVKSQGALQWLAREAVEHCEAQHATAAAVDAAVRMAAER
jgi:hypothetical protein